MTSALQHKTLIFIPQVHLEDLGEQMLHLQQLFPKVPGADLGNLDLLLKV